ncbi:MAG: hypothetical protein ACREAA_17080 [Candidatus Polarisedimenticolia bacterium]
MSVLAHRLVHQAAWTVLAIAFTATPAAARVPHPCTPPVSGDWVITGTMVCTGKALVLPGSIIVQGPAGSLSFINSQVRFATGGSRLHAQGGSRLTIDNSQIDTPGTGIRFDFFIDAGVIFSLTRSSVRHFGSLDPEIWVHAPTTPAQAALGNRYLWEHTYPQDVTDDDGLVVRSTPVSFSDNTFDDYTVIRFFSSSNTIVRNHFLNMKHEGLAFVAGSNQNVVTDNVFEQSAVAARMNRTIYGLRFYPPSVPCEEQQQEIARNHFERLPYTYVVGLIDPWGRGCNYSIHDNTHARTSRGAAGAFVGATIERETFSNVMAGISLSGTSYSSIRNSRFSNLTYQMEIEGQIGRDYWELLRDRDIFEDDHFGFFTFQFYAGKTIVMLSQRGAGIVLENNTFENAPPGTIAINNDGVNGFTFDVIGNTFRSIGTYIPQGYTVRRDVNGHVGLGNLTPIPGAAIMLETAQNARVLNNVFQDVQAALTTSSLDALGNWGDLEFRGNLVVNTGPSRDLSWMEEVWNGIWYGNPLPRTAPTIGVATGMDMWTGTGLPTLDQHESFKADALQLIVDNSFVNLKVPIAADYRRRVVSEWGTMGPKRLDFTLNDVSGYDQCPIWDASQDSMVNQLIFHDNTWSGGPSCPQDMDAPPPPPND